MSFTTIKFISASFQLITIFFKILLSKTCRRDPKLSSLGTRISFLDVVKKERKEHKMADFC